jgi:hypothetical protein
MARRPLGGSNVQPERSLCGWQQFEAGEWKIAAERRMQLWSFLVVDYDRSGLKFMTWKE